MSKTGGVAAGLGFPVSRAAAEAAAEAARRGGAILREAPRTALSAGRRKAMTIAIARLAASRLAGL